MEKISLLAKLKEEKRVAIEYQKRRHAQWQENYELYRDIVETNALTQRQALNIPIMKETIKTVKSRIDEPPDVEFDCLEDGAEARDKEIVINEMWKDDSDKQNFDSIDILEKNNVLLRGRTFKKLNWLDGVFQCEVPGILDVVIDPKTKPIDIETARFIIHLHIFKPLREILANVKYSDEGKADLKTYLQNPEDGGKGKLLTFAEDATQEAKEAQLQSLGVNNFDEFGAANVMVELNEHCTLIWDEKKKKFIRNIVVVAEGNAILFQKTMKETLGVDFWPYISWADDLEGEDFWSDGIADVVRTPNKVMNIYFSTMTENRVMRNLGMYWYLPVSGFDPQTFEPEPFGMYPAPMVKDESGRLMTVEQVVHSIQIPALEDSLVSIDFLMKLVERATAATAIEKGQGEKKQMTLGEVEALMQKSAERMVSMAKFYRRAWKEFAWKWLKIKEANVGNAKMKLYKKGTEDSYFEKEISTKDWKSEKGYKVRVISSSEQENKQVEGMKKLEYASAKYPNNPAIQKIVKKRVLEFLDITPDEMKEIEQAETMTPINPTGPVNQNNQPVAKAPITAMPMIQ